MELLLDRGMSAPTAQTPCMVEHSPLSWAAESLPGDGVDLFLGWKDINLISPVNPIEHHSCDLPRMGVRSPRAARGKKSPPIGFLLDFLGFTILSYGDRRLLVLYRSCQMSAIFALGGLGCFLVSAFGSNLQSTSGVRWIKLEVSWIS